jgi:glycosyltransferase involved in cell wall biosynthesis
MTNIQKKIILFILPSLEGGGAERVIVNIMSHLNNKKYETHLALFKAKGPYLSSLPGHIIFHDLKKRKSGLFSVIKDIFVLRRLLKNIKPDVVVSFLNMTNVLAVISRFLSCEKFKLILGIRIYFHKDLIKNFNKFSLFLFKIFFKYGDCFIVNSIELKKYSAQFFNIDMNKIHTIYNPLDFENINKLKDENLDYMFSKEYILAVGRLADEKGFSYLLKAFSLIKEKLHEKLVILGEGPDKQKLKELANDLGIQERVVFLGFQNNPYKYMKNAKIFVLSSLYEGFPNVLIEAMACGAPVISTDCTSGPGEIIENYKSGILVSPANEKALAEAMLTLLTNGDLRKRFSFAGQKIVENFRIEDILSSYEQIF